MYKRITHHIVEEHFDHPTAVEMSEGIKKTFKPPLRYYADGQQMASDLPPSYAIGTNEKNCGNCLAFNSSNNSCKKWMLPVRAEYVCAAWTLIPS